MNIVIAYAAGLTRCGQGLRANLQSLDRGGTVTVEQLQDTLFRSQMQPLPAANDVSYTTELCRMC